MRFYPHGFSVASAYKDPVETQFMKKILDKLIIGFFVLNLGIVWYFTTKYNIKPNQYNIIVYDPFGKEFNLEGIRTNFKTKQVAISFLKDYKIRFPVYDFSIEEQLPEFRNRPRLTFKKNYR